MQHSFHDAASHTKQDITLNLGTMGIFNAPILRTLREIKEKTDPQDTDGYEVGGENEMNERVHMHSRAHKRLHYRAADERMVGE